MATVIDAFVVELNLDPAKYKKGQIEADTAVAKTKDSALKGAKEWEALQKRAGEYLSGLHRKVLGLAGLLIGGLGVEQLASRFIPFNAQLGRSARDLGMSSRELMIWEAAGRTVGAQTGEITASFGALTDAIARFSTAQPEQAVALFRMFGIEMRKTNGEFKTAADLARELARVYPTQDPRRMKLFLDQLGVGTGLRNLIALGAELDKLIDRTGQLSNFSQANVDAAQTAQAAWGELQTAAENLGNALVTTFGPGATKIIRDFTDQIMETLHPGTTNLTEHHAPIDQRFSWVRRVQSAPWGELSTAEKAAAWFLRDRPDLASGAGAPAPSGPIPIAPYGAAWKDYRVRQRDFFDLRGGGLFDHLGAQSMNNTSRSSPVTIGSITVETRATDAAGIARDIRSALEENALASQANYGMG